MLDFIMVPLIVWIICSAIYSLFELFARKKERLTLIEKMGGEPFTPEVIPNQANMLRLPAVKNSSFSSLKLGSLLAGLGLGLLVGFFLYVNTKSSPAFNHNWVDYEMRPIIFGASTLLFGGLSLVVAFIIELKLTKRKDKEKQG